MAVLQYLIEKNVPAMAVLQDLIEKNVPVMAVLQDLQCDYRGHASVRLPGVLHTNVGHSKFGYRMLKKFIRSDISAFVHGHYQVRWRKLLRVKWWIFR